MAVLPTATSVLPEASGGTGTTTGYYGFKNRIINSAMVIDQRGSATTPVTISGYATDRWGQGSPVVSKISTQQSTTTTTGFSNSLASTVSSAYTPAAGEVFRIYQRIEGLNCVDLAFGSASAATVTLSFWVRSSVTGTYAVSLQNSAGNRSYVATYTVNAANTFEQKTITIAGDTSGTWLTTNGIGIQVAFCQQTGSTFQTTAGSWQAGEYYGVAGAASWLPTSGATFYITGVQLEKGSTATSFDYRPYGTELNLCQRYYTQSWGTGAFSAVGSSANGTASNASNAVVAATFSVSMRAAPTVTLYDNVGASGKVTQPFIANGLAGTAGGIGTNGFKDISGSGYTSGSALFGNYIATSEL
jgi:hypothetical protein